LDSLGRDTRITYLRTRRKMLLVRDMVHLTHDIFLRDETIISLSFSVNTSQCPPLRGVIRSQCNFQCWILKPIRDTDNASLHKTHVTQITHIDPKGTIGHLGKQYFYNIFGVKPLKSLRKYIHKQTTSKGYRRIRHSMYNFFASSNREESIHEVSDNECSSDSIGFYNEIKKLNPEWDRDPITMFIDQRLRSQDRKDKEPGNNKAEKPEVGIKVASKQALSEDLISPEQRSVSVGVNETTPDCTNVSWTVNENSSTAGLSSSLFEAGGPPQKPITERASQRIVVGS